MLPEIVFAPRIFIEVDAPGSPADGLTITFEALAAREFAINDSPERVISPELIDELVDPCLSRLASKPNAVTLIACKPIASTSKAKFCVTEPLRGTSTLAFWLL